MKKVIKLFFLIVLFNVMIINVSAKANQYSKYEQSAFGGQIINCTWQQTEDNTEKIYKLNIIREAKEEKKISKKNGILISLGIATGVVGLFIVIYELIIKKKKNK